MTPKFTSDCMRHICISVPNNILGNYRPKNVKMLDLVRIWTTDRKLSSTECS